MGRILGIDYGTKRTGLAVTDPSKIIATGLTTIPTHSIFEYLSKYFEEQKVDFVVIGLPKQTNNEPSESMKHIEPFVKKFQSIYPNIPIEYYDERFTSLIAHKTILASGLKKKARQNKALVDEISAVIILQDYMESITYKNKI